MKSKMNIGDVVYVWLHGKIEEGMIVENNEVTPLLASMVVVRVPIQGHTLSALFTPNHVYATEEEVRAAHKQFNPADVKHKRFEMTFDTDPHPHPYENIPLHPYFGPTIPPEVDLRIQLEIFKQKHWDHEHNHIDIKYINEFYELWRAASCPILKIDVDKAAEFPEGGSTGVIYYADNKPVSKSDTPSKEKTAKKKDKSTGVIKYSDATQLSIF